MLEGVIRESITKANAKALKKDGYLIANIYGKGVENVSCAFKLNPFIKYLKEKKHLIFPVKLGDKTFEVVVQEYQKNPVTNELIHVDLLAVTKGVKSKFKVPVKHQGTPVGLKNKGILMLSKKRISVECTPEHLPDHYLVDVAPLDVNESILVCDLEKHENVKILDHDSIAVIGVIKAK